jgi:hypothetical protein
MHDGCKSGVEKAWLVTALTVYVFHRLLETAPGGDGLWLFEALMIILTFPFGPLAMLFLALGVSELRGLMDVGWILDWSTLLFVGYIQWFVVLPEIRRNSKLTVLNLTTPVEVASTVKSASPVEIAPPVEIVSPVEVASPASPNDSLTLPEVAPVGFNAADFLPALAEFDEAGLTALDKVLRASPSAPPARQAPPSCDEVIFPAVLGSRA